MATVYITLRKNKMWELVLLPNGKNIVGYKWVYKTKYGADGQIDKHKEPRLLLMDGLTSKLGL
jgi:hypothetical protein